MVADARHPQQFGLPSAATLQQYDIWVSYFSPSDSGRDSSRLLDDIERSLPTLELGGIRRLCVFLHVGLGTGSSAIEERVRSNPDSILDPLKRWPDRLLGMIRLNPHDVRAALDAVNRWIGDGPMVGVYFPGGGPGSLACSHPNYEPLVKRIAELDGVIMQHNWFKTGGKESPGASTPDELAVLASRFPEVSFISAHAGGEWERGIRAVRGTPNVLIETSGFDPTAGFIDMAVRDLGAERVVFGSHLPSRSLGTELGKVTAADITHAERRLILGENLRRLLAPIMKKKGMV